MTFMDWMLAVDFVCTIALIAGVVTLALSQVKLHIELEAMKRSTHTLTYIDPLKQNFGNVPQVDPLAEEDPELSTIQ